MTNDQIEIVPVINAKDFEEFKRKVKLAEPFFDLVQIDIMDGKFVKTKNFGEAELVKKIKTKVHWELHLMVWDVEKWINSWLEVPNVARIIFHIEPLLSFDQAPTIVGARGEVRSQKVLDSPPTAGRSNSNKGQEVQGLIQQIKKQGAQVGLALNPETPISTILPYLPPHQNFGRGGSDQLDIVLLLTVSPGKSGQEFMSEVIHKIKQLRKIWPNGKIEVDGGINPATAKISVDAGANVLASGSYLFTKGQMAKAIKELKNHK